jgi:hypothetical protein
MIPREDILAQMERMKVRGKCKGGRRPSRRARLSSQGPKAPALPATLRRVLEDPTATALERAAAILCYRAAESPLMAQPLVQGLMAKVAAELDAETLAAVPEPCPRLGYMVADLQRLSWEPLAQATAVYAVTSVGLSPLRVAVELVVLQAVAAALKDTQSAKTELPSFVSAAAGVE